MSLSDPEIEFLRESTRIKFLESPEVTQRRGISRRTNIPTVDYSQPENQKVDKGYAGVVIQIRKIAESRRPIEVDELPGWQKLIVDEQKEFGYACRPETVGVIRSESNRFEIPSGNAEAPDASDVPALLEKWLADFNHAALRTMLKPRFFHPICLVEFAAPLYQRFEQLAPFAGGNGCLARAFFNYFPTLVGYPLTIFRIEEQDAFLEARVSSLQMQKYIAAKLRCEVPCNCKVGAIAVRVHETAWLDTYKCESCSRMTQMPWYELRPLIE